MGVRFTDSLPLNRDKDLNRIVLLTNLQCQLLYVQLFYIIVFPAKTAANSEFANALQICTCICIFTKLFVLYLFTIFTDK